MKPIKKTEPKEPVYLKIWGLQIPLAKPLKSRESQKLYFAYLILLLVLAVFASKAATVAAGGATVGKAVTWVKSLASQKAPRSP